MHRGTDLKPRVRHGTRRGRVPCGTPMETAMSCNEILTSEWQACWGDPGDQHYCDVRGDHEIDSKSAAWRCPIHICLCGHRWVDVDNVPIDVLVQQ